MNEREINIVRQTVVDTLQMLGVESGYMSYNRGCKVFGKAFRTMVRRGEIQPVRIGEGRNGTHTYSISEILSKMA